MPITKQQKLITRKKLLASAYHLFSNKGFKQASIDEICVGAGVTRGAFYSHFENKQELFLQCFSEQASVSLIQQQKNNPVKDKKWILGLFNEYVRINTENDRSDTCPVAYLLQDASTMDTKFQEVYKKSVTFIADTIEPAFISKKDALSVVAMMIGTVNLMKSISCEVTRQALVDSGEEVIGRLCGEAG